MTGFTETQLTVREAVGKVCARFPNTYWREHDKKEQDPVEFHVALAEAGWLGIALPEALGGGSGLGIAEAVMMMQTIAESGAGMAGAQAGGPVAGVFRGVTEPNAGLDTLRLATTATRTGSGVPHPRAEDLDHLCAGGGQDDPAGTPRRRWTRCASRARACRCSASTSTAGGPGWRCGASRRWVGRAVDANEVFFRRLRGGGGHAGRRRGQRLSRWCCTA